MLRVNFFECIECGKNVTEAEPTFSFADVLFVLWREVHPETFPCRTSVVTCAGVNRVVACRVMTMSVKIMRNGAGHLPRCQSFNALRPDMDHSLDLLQHAFDQQKRLF